MSPRVKKILRCFGAGKALSMLRSFRFAIDLIKFSKMYATTSKRHIFKILDIYPIIHEKTSTTSFDRHYIFHTAWAARVLRDIAPDEHIDISSSLFFNVISSAFVPIRFYDYRPVDLGLSGLATEKGDLINLPFSSNSIHSLSCMHVVEHVGLGRYGDSLDVDGDLKAINELKRVMAIHGNLLFVVPIGVAKIIYNAHRIYSYSQIIEYFQGFELIEFSLICDDEKITTIVYNASKNLADKQKYGCGCFWFRKNSI